LIVGAAPGVGGSVASWVSYENAKKLAKNSELYGTGIPEGVLASECSDNACASGDLIPLFTLAIPGGSMAAVLMGAFLIVGVELGPRFYIDHGTLAYEIIISLFLTTMISLILSIFLVKPSAKIASLPTKVVIPLIFCLGVIGSYGTRTSLFGVYVFFVLGFASYILKCLDIPLPPIVIGFILGPIAEANMQRTLSMFKNNFWLIFTRPVSVILILLIIFTLLFPLIKKRKQLQTG
jgi:putative tricarboxylic transport membrane protein